ncbi:WD40 repeat domain-containing protein [Streptomyces sp. NPDC057638]|uniref:WD40 repeat domain-containing protein n=1 Tax=Streptomyces sp. NPDC057638 TaxID=3346190 RepID=UPI0036AC8000
MQRFAHELPATARGGRDHVPGDGAARALRGGHALATTGPDRTVRLWDTHSRKLRTTLTGHNDEITQMLFSPDGRTLATSGHDRIVRWWDTATGTQRATLTRHHGPIRSLAYSPDGTTFTTVSTHETTATARTSNVALPTPVQALARICRTLDRDLTPAEHAQYLAGASAPPPC